MLCCYKEVNDINDKADTVETLLEEAPVEPQGIQKEPSQTNNQTMHEATLSTVVPETNKDLEEVGVSVVPEPTKEEPTSSGQPAQEDGSICRPIDAEPQATEHPLELVQEEPVQEEPPEAKLPQMDREQSREAEFGERGSVLFGNRGLMMDARLFHGLENIEDLDMINKARLERDVADIKKLMGESTGEGELEMVGRCTRIEESDVSVKHELFWMGFRYLLCPTFIVLTWIWPKWEDPLKNPSAWWGDHVIATPAYQAVCGCYFQLQLLGPLTHKFDALSMKTFIPAFIASTSLYLALRVGAALLWQHALNFNPPVPFGMLLIGTPCGIFMITFFVYGIPRHLRKEKPLRKRLLFAIVQIVVVCNFFSGFYVLTVCFAQVRGVKQLIFVPLMLIFRETWAWIASKVSNLLAKDDLALELVNTHVIATVYTTILTLVIGSLAEDYVEAALLGVDTLVYLIVILRAARRYPGTDEAERRKLSLLIIQELMVKSREVLIPALYVLAYLGLYYGPNGEVIGLVKNKDWHYEHGADIDEVLVSVARMLCIDLVALLTVAVYLWQRKGINVFKLLFAIERKYGLKFWSDMALTFMACFNLNSLYAGQDMTLKFAYVRRD